MERIEADIVRAAACTAIDRAESEPEIAAAVNSAATLLGRIGVYRSCRSAQVEFSLVEPDMST